MGKRPTGSGTLTIVLTTTFFGCIISDPFLDTLGSGKLTSDIKSAVQISLDTDSLLASGQTISVTWSGVNQPGSQDVVALLAVPDGTASLGLPVRWRPASDASGASSGAGSLKFRVINYRVPLRFAYLQPDGAGGAKIVGTSAPITMRDVNEPLQGRLVLTGKTGELRVLWTSKESDTPRVYWGRVKADWEGSVTASSSPITFEGDCAALGPQTLNQAVLTGLKPSTTYFYKFGDVRWYFTPIYNFTTPPEVGSDVSAKALFFADAGQAPSDGAWGPGGRQEGSLETATALASALASGFSLLVNGGDLVLQQSPLAWDTFFDEFGASLQMAPLQVSASPTSTAPGCRSSLTLAQRFAPPGVASGAALYYSYNFGPMHFLHYDSSQDLSPSSAQYSFLEADMRGVDRSKTPWLVVVGSQPVFPPSGLDAAAASSLQSLFQAQRVDLVLQGHDNWYQRAISKSSGTAPGGGPVYVVAGNAGTAADAPSQAAGPAGKLVGNQVGYLRLDAQNGKLQVSFLSSTTGSVLDSFTVAPNGGGSAGTADSSVSSSLARAPAPAVSPGGRGPAPAPAPDARPGPAPAPGAGRSPAAAPAGGPAGPRRRRPLPRLHPRRQVSSRLPLFWRPPWRPLRNPLPPSASATHAAFAP
eukprot:jgi/Botrbrau1/5149/Bobra.0172s0021.1